MTEIELLKKQIDILEKENSELKKRWQNQTNHEAITQAEKMKILGELAGGIAHDFNNQLMGIVGYTSLLQKIIKDEKGLRFLEHIKTASKNSTELVGQLLTFARKGPLDEAPVNIHTIINEATSILERTIDKKISVTKKLRAENFTVKGDAARLQNALLNMGLNARDALPNGGTICFRTFNHESQPDLIEIVVEDDGTGIPKSIQSRIFEPFFSTKEKGKGTGMGLAAVFGTVKSHHGNIEVDSSPSQGTKFFITLPTIENTDAAEGDEVPLTMGQGEILVIDDEEMVRSLMTDTLQSLGYKSTTFGEGKQALEYYKKEQKKIVLILLDIVMPTMSGDEVFAELRKINPKCKVLFLSGYVPSEKIQHTIQANNCQFLQKPFTQEKLSHHIAAIIK